MQDWRPPHAYVPGQTPRHAEALFDPFKQIADPLEASPAWSLGLNLLQDGYFWEAHELLEPVWMAAPENSGTKCLVQGVIQLANARLKVRMDRPRAAARLLLQARGLLDEAFVRGGACLMGLTRKDADRMYEESRRECVL
ncbi:DUF309 domain-containing protein [Tropicibacter oceani]|uniref:DUF309 domain-containing protein n=1 Tax=Tropicibacter oceani TaxID=3058420 RepID=A0ABY8QEE4_9RHOB|nr:DUF309 domain-containing protein [Tropicibacter oceani]WGW02378.1 DUF309 domain-containing protein [Tropicibacter oceani]